MKTIRTNAGLTVAKRQKIALSGEEVGTALAEFLLRKHGLDAIWTGVLVFSQVVPGEIVCTIEIGPAEEDKA